jgi:hypothetical protein
MKVSKLIDKLMELVGGDLHVLNMDITVTQTISLKEVSTDEGVEQGTEASQTVP